MGDPPGNSRFCWHLSPSLLRTEYNLFRLSLSQPSDWDLLKPKKQCLKRDRLAHRYLRKVDCSSFVMCPFLALVLPSIFLWQSLTVLTRQTRQGVCAIIQSNFSDLFTFWLYLPYPEKSFVLCLLCSSLVKFINTALAFSIEKKIIDRYRLPISH
jgi:hypothetical protein